MKYFSKTIFLVFLLGALAPLFIPTTSSAQAACFTFTRPLKLGSTGSDVKALQQFLNSQGFPVAPYGAGSPGNESAIFGAKTRTAVVKFQAAYNIYPAAGYFGSLSQAKARTLCNTASTATTSVIRDPAIGVGVGSGTVIASPVFTISTSTTITAAITPPISASSIVGVLCIYQYRGTTQLMKGSGVIVNPEGYILTARHILDPRWTATAYADTLSAEDKDLYQNATLEHCEVGLPQDATLPSADDIRQFNPSLLITRNFQYRAEPYVLPSHNGLSENEYNNADFAVMRITSATTNCALFNKECNDFGAFPYTPVSTGPAPHESDSLLSYGYPVETSLNHDGEKFYDFYLKGAAGTVGLYILGNQRFAGEPVSFAFHAHDIQNGRSGSPLFQNGRVVGILYGSTSAEESFNVSMSVISAILGDSGQASLLRTQ